MNHALRLTYRVGWLFVVHLLATWAQGSPVSPLKAPEARIHAISPSTTRQPITSKTAMPLSGGISLTTLGVGYSQNFDTAPASGSATWTNDSSIPGWYHARTGTGTTIVANNGSSNVGNLYSYGTGTATDRALGSVGSGNAAIGNLYWGVRLVNNTGTTITSLTVAYTGEQWRNSAAAAQSIAFSYLVGSPSVTGSLAEFQSAGVTVSPLDFTSPITGGTAGALDGNVAANRVALSHTITGLNIPNGTEVMLRWSDPDHTGADHGLSIDDFSVTPNGTPAPATPTITPAPVGLSFNYTEGSGPSPAENFTASGSNLTGDVTATASTNYELSLTSGGSFGSSVTLSPSSGTLGSTTVFVRLKAGLGGGSYPGTVSFTGGGLTTPSSVSLSGSVTTLSRIHDVQSSGATSPLVGSQVTIEGIVTRAFTGSSRLNGFFVQEEDADADANPATSEGVFVFDPSGLFSGNAGDKVRVTGTVAEFTSSTSSLTQLTSLTSVVNLGAGTLPSVSNVTLPVGNVSDLERYEGMLVNVSAASGNLTVTENFQLGRFGQVVLSATGDSNQPGTDARLDQYTQFNAPSVSGYSAYLAEIAKRRIFLDDGSSSQNLDPILFGRGGNPLSASNTLRGGDGVASLTGILDHRFEGYRVQTSTGVDFQPTNARPATPPAVGGSLNVLSTNVLNYFNGDGAGGGFPTSRGADNPTEFTRQRDKIVAALIGSGADVIGIMEVENDGFGPTSAIQDLVNGLNAVAGAGTYAFVNPGVGFSSDEITVGILYKPGKVTTVGTAAVLPSGYGTGSFDLVDRRPLAQTFRETATGGVFTIAVNHFKSKGSSSGGAGDADAGDGQGLSNGTRTRQAQDLAAWLATKPTGTEDPDYLILGDLNAYAKEDPLTTLANAGYQNLLPITTYSFVFDGQVGSLDHALATSGLASQVSGSAKWHINADEPTVLDYNTEFKSAGLISSLYNPDAFRSSDHDPVLVGFDLTIPITFSASSVALKQGETLTGTAIASVVGAEYLPDGANVAATSPSNGVTLTNISFNPSTGTVTADVAATCDASDASFTLTLNYGPNSTTATLNVDVTTEKPSVEASATPNPVCEGEVLTLQASTTSAGTYTYSWSGPNSFAASSNLATRTVAKTDGGVYGVTVTYGSNCTVSASTASVVVTPGSFVGIPTVAGAPVCAGQAVTLSFGFNCPANYTFTARLSDANGAFNPGTPLGTVTPGANTVSIPSGTPNGTGYRIQVVASDPNLTPAVSAAFRVNALGQVAIATPTTPGKLCQGEALSIAFSTTGTCPFPLDNVFSVQLSSATGSFANPTVLGTALPGTTPLTLPSNLPPGTGYRVRVVSSNPTLSSSPSLPFRLEGPSLAVSPGVGNVPACTGGEITVSLTLSPNSCPFPEGNTFTAQLSSATGSFNNPTNLGAILPGEVTRLALPATVVAGTGYRLRVVSSTPSLTSSNSALFRINACPGRFAAEDPTLTVVPNPVQNGSVRCRVTGLDTPRFSLTNALGRTLSLQVGFGDEPGAYVLRSQSLPAGVYVLQASEGPRRLTQRVMVVE